MLRPGNRSCSHNQEWAWKQPSLQEVMTAYWPSSNKPIVGPLSVRYIPSQDSRCPWCPCCQVVDPQICLPAIKQLCETDGSTAGSLAVATEDCTRMCQPAEVMLQGPFGLQAQQAACSTGKLVQAHLRASLLPGPCPLGWQVTLHAPPHHVQCSKLVPGMIMCMCTASMSRMVPLNPLTRLCCDLTDPAQCASPVSLQNPCLTVSCCPFTPPTCVPLLSLQ